MPLFEIDSTDGLIPFRQLHGGSELYESEIEDLLWPNLDEFTGEALFPVARQARIANRGIPDIVALDKHGNPIVCEIKRDVDRGQLAQCLEYAGWARTATIEDFARVYHSGPDQFFSDWQEFTESPTLVLLTRSPRLFLVAHDFDDRTDAALEFLLENGLPVQVIRVALYADLGGRRFVVFDGDHEPELHAVAEKEDSPVHTQIDGRRFRISDLLDSDLIEPGEELVWDRPRRREKFTARVTENGAIQLSDGRTFSSPSRAAGEAAGKGAFDGWYAWSVPRLDGRKLNDLRVELSQQ